MSFIEKKKEINKKIFKLKKLILDLELELRKIDTQICNQEESNIIKHIKLNDQQQQIVHSEQKNILVIACPGSGKTHTLISRYIYLVTTKKVNPDDIVLITFTKKAGQEMYDRINNIIPNKLPFYVGSLHGLAFKLLQEYNNINYTIIDENESKELLLSLITDDENDDQKIKTLKKYIWDIYNHHSCYYPISVKKSINRFKLNKYDKIIELIFKKYQNIKKTQNIIDFNDLMILFSKLIKTKKFEPFLEKIKYIFFDEYQDINPIQNYILNSFEKNSNIMVVGDDAQSIYSFRGSDISFIQNFEKTYNDSKKFFLEVNYRSTPEVINLFQDVIKKNSNQFEKNIIPFKKSINVKPNIVDFSNQNEQYKWIIKDIKTKLTLGVNINDIVVIARTNKCLINFEYHALKNNIPIFKSMGETFLHKDYIKDFLAFIVVIYNPKSTIHWKRLLVLHKNISFELASKILNENTNVLKSIDIWINKNLKKEIFNDLKNIQQFFCKINKITDVKQITILILNYLSEIWENNINEKITVINNMLTYIKDYNLKNFISDIYLNLEISENVENSLFLTTIHGAKGLEWDHVYIIDVNTQNFPYIRNSHYENQIFEMDEERRLFYVALSRAKKNITISYYQDFNSYYKIRISPFLIEINNTFFNSSNINITDINLTGNISSDIYEYLKFRGFSNILFYLKNLLYKKQKILTKEIENDDIPKYIIKNFYSNLLIKMLSNNFITEFKNVNTQHLNKNLSDITVSNFKDKHLEWKDSLKTIWDISKKKSKADSKILNNMNFFIHLENKFVEFIKKLKPKKIINNVNLNHKLLKGESTLIIDEYLFEFYFDINEISTIQNILTLEMYIYLLSKKDIKIKYFCMFNIFRGTIEIFDLNNLNLTKLKKIIYS